MSLLQIHAKDFTHQNYGTGKNKKKGGKLPPSLYVRAVKKIFFAFCVRDLNPCGHSAQSVLNLSLFPTRR